MTLTAKALSLFLVAVMLTGCVGNLIGDDEPEIVIEEPTPQWTYFNETYEFENAMAMGHAATWEYNMTVNSTMTMTWDIQCRFEQPLFGEAGYVNITLERDGDVLVSEEYTSPETAFFNLTFNASNITGDGFTLRIQSVGSDHTLSGGMEDYYIVQTAIEYI
jgi:hypothetical protein